MPVYYNIMIPMGNGLVFDKNAISEAALKLGPAIKKALVSAIAQDATYQELFYSVTGAKDTPQLRAEVNDLVKKVLSAMDNFLSNTSNIVSIVSRRNRESAGIYAYIGRDLGRSGTGQWFICLGPEFYSAPVVNLAHELSHHFGTNGLETGYPDEIYDEEAMRLPSTEPMYAASNADNYGHFVDRFA
jgi:hypothetical protein